MKHEMKIMVRRANEKPISVAAFKKLPLLERVKNRWFGKVERLMVIVPSESVEKIEIKEV